MNNIYVINTKDVNYTNDKPIYLEKICFRPLIEYCIDIASVKSSEYKPYIITNSPEKLSAYNKNSIIINDIHDVKTDNVDNVIILNAASPLITSEVIEFALDYMINNDYQTIRLGECLCIVSVKYSTNYENLFSSQNYPIQTIIKPKNLVYETIVCKDYTDIAFADKILRLKINLKYIKNGVKIIDPENTYIANTVEIGTGSVIFPNNFIEGYTKIGMCCKIYPGCNIADASIGDNVTINNSTICNSIIEDYTSIGPYAYIRPESKIGKNVKIGDFVELKKANIGSNTKVSHLTYIGDSVVGENVNFGCGTVTVNYDGENKYLTEIGDNAFIGCNTNLIAPVKIGNNSYIAAGSTITDDVPENSLAIARQRQTNKECWVKPKDRT